MPLFSDSDSESDFDPVISPVNIKRNVLKFPHAISTRCSSKEQIFPDQSVPLKSSKSYKGSLSFLRRKFSSLDIEIVTPTASLEKLSAKVETTCDDGDSDFDQMVCLDDLEPEYDLSRGNYRTNKSTEAVELVKEDMTRTNKTISEEAQKSDMQFIG